ncbi:hypothetical protein Y032_0004g1850 [Ancylostoma ceylanicum]|uniref:Uncharacterized protein n=1 Tax=Ancylostoma ceylanicum TaxID=53326 RepID=A0A016VU33_9BILA|nr:hypothetical protein Y032_0004g1850 [Ancylostoma ceylanicum]
MTGSEPSTLAYSSAPSPLGHICFLTHWAKMKYMMEDLVKKGFKPDRFRSDLPVLPLALPLLVHFHQKNS